MNLFTDIFFTNEFLFLHFHFINIIPICKCSFFTIIIPIHKHLAKYWGIYIYIYIYNYIIYIHTIWNNNKKNLSFVYQRSLSKWNEKKNIYVSRTRNNEKKAKLFQVFMNNLWLLHFWQIHVLFQLVSF